MPSDAVRHLTCCIWSDGVDELCQRFRQARVSESDSAHIIQRPANTSRGGITRGKRSEWGLMPGLVKGVANDDVCEACRKDRDRRANSSE
ncbi:hypothetical protein RRG08_054141 [Elysia crispata]|uniref:Uncharacterized protein n=1 Tax=Elysia crispata TaxID=231223 RepID=A0AAE0Y8Z7_9GAST|nr:hypothetical protein RRG08_054141 [Elysia crispata]